MHGPSPGTILHGIGCFISEAGEEARTNELIHQQIAQANEQGTAPADMLNLLTALVMVAGVSGAVGGESDRGFARINTDQGQTGVVVS